MSITHLITAGSYLIINSNAFLGIFPKWVKRISESPTSKFNVFYTSRKDDPERIGRHRLLIANNAIAVDNSEDGFKKYRAKPGPKILLVQNNQSRGLDFLILEPKNNPENYTMPLRKLEIKSLRHETGWQIMGVCDEGRNKINIATINLTNIIREYDKIS